jgi:hypothetical protein
MKERALESAKKIGNWTKLIIKKNEYEYKYNELRDMIQKSTFKDWLNIVIKAQCQLEELEKLRIENSELRKELRDERNRK